MIYLFEDHTIANFTPLVYMRPVYDLRCGLRTLREKILAYYPNVPYGLWCRPAVQAIVEEQNPGLPVNTSGDGPDLFINGRVIMDEALARILTIDGPETLYIEGETLVAARLHKALCPDLFDRLPAELSIPKDIVRINVQTCLVDYAWDLIRRHEEEMVRDYRQIDAASVDTSLYPHIHFLNEQAVHIGTDAVVMPGVVLDASEGPVLIGDGVHIMPHTYIQGPAAIGDHSIVRAGTRLYAGVSIGPVCKIGGEITASILYGYTNKQHDGFLGHAYLGPWGNIGAGAGNSNLKNTYGPISMMLNGAQINTNMMFLGLVAGDYVKAGIGTQFTTGSMIGFSSNIAGVAFPPSSIPSFSWYTGAGPTDFKVDKAIEGAQRMMARRQVKMSLSQEQRFRQIYEDTVEERQ